jgi:hypothetical protein
VEWPGSKPATRGGWILGSEEVVLTGIEQPMAAQSERRWGHREAVEGAGRVVEGARGIGAELGVVSGARRGTGVVVQGGSVMACKAGFGAAQGR